jgi:hypothetical protein
MGWLVWLNLFLVIAAKVYIDWRQWKDKHVINHTMEIAMVAVEVCLVTYWILGWKPGLLLLQSAVYWIVFDPPMAMAIGQKPFYIGSTAWPDKLFYGKKFGEVWILVGKVLFLLVSYIAYVLL